ncbi:tryptophan synthetase [Puccinia graminis f. sp. tritici]|uniref:Tryptophan synthetase n=1 Tax=Puccinia graminis f. sp. tritici TaxID=56615 RepID=A0A5B0LUJ1_PUCGR|nr:tryptophan synthetase [Puccinia graminis f. sp. tritici]
MARRNPSWPSGPVQDQASKICTSHSISAGLDDPAVGPKLAWLKENGRTEFCSATDFEAIQGSQPPRLYSLNGQEDRVDGTLPEARRCAGAAHARPQRA